MEKRSNIKSIDVDLRGESVNFTIDIPRNAKKVTGIIVTSKLTGDNMPVNRHYYGVAAIPGAYNNAFIQTLENEVMESTVKTVSLNAAVGQKIFYARPVEVESQPSFEFDGVSVSFLDPQTISVTDPDTGHVRNYYLYESADSGVGQKTVGIL